MCRALSDDSFASVCGKAKGIAGEVATRGAQLLANLFGSSASAPARKRTEREDLVIVVPIGGCTAGELVAMHRTLVDEHRDVPVVVLSPGLLAGLARSWSLYA
jgi:hypothetical protein